MTHSTLPPLPDPASGPRSHSRRSFWLLMHRTAWVATAVHVVFVGLFAGLGAGTLAWANVGSVLLYAVVLVLQRQRRNLAAALLVLVEILVHATVAVLAIGWQSGFHFYVTLVIPVVFLTGRSRRLQWAIVLPVLLIYIGLDTVAARQPPWHAINPLALDLLRHLNMVASLAILAHLSATYQAIVREAEGQLHRQATTDPLTGLANRRHLVQQADALLRRGAAPAPTLALVLADIDHFKAINDSRGHEGGDEVLRVVSARLSAGCRPHDVVARWGGEEFLVLLPAASLEDAGRAAERLREAVSGTPVALPGGALRVTLSMGVCALAPGESLDDAVRRADAALYRAKQAGRDRVERADAAGTPALA